MKRPFLLENLVSGASQPVKFSKTTFSTARSSTVFGKDHLETRAIAITIVDIGPVAVVGNTQT